MGLAAFQARRVQAVRKDELDDSFAIENITPTPAKKEAAALVQKKSSAKGAVRPKKQAKVGV